MIIKIKNAKKTLFVEKVIGLSYDDDGFVTVLVENKSDKVLTEIQFSSVSKAKKCYFAFVEAVEQGKEVFEIDNDLKQGKEEETENEVA